MSYQSHVTGECCTASMRGAQYNDGGSGITLSHSLPGNQVSIGESIASSATHNSIEQAHDPTLANWVSLYSRENRLSPQESRLLLLAVEGVDNDVAAAHLRCTRPTIATYWNRIFKKTNVSCQRDVLGSMLRWIVLREALPAQGATFAKFQRKTARVSCTSSQ